MHNSTDHHSGNSVSVLFDDESHVLEVVDELTFGRQADIVVDETNRSLHRLLGRIWYADGQWWIANLGRSIALVLTDLDGASFARIVPGAELPLPFANVSITFSAGKANYRLTVHHDGPLTSRRAASSPEVLDGEHTRTASGLVFNEEQYQLLVALARLRIDGPLAAAELPSNRQLARELEWSPAKLTRKLDHLCAKLDRAGVVGLVGSSAGSANDRRRRLADAAVEHGLVTRADLT